MRNVQAMAAAAAALQGKDRPLSQITGRPLRTLMGHISLVASVAFSPDGRLALSGSADKTVRIWEIFPN